MEKVYNSLMFSLTTIDKQNRFIIFQKLSKNSLNQHYTLINIKGSTLANVMSVH